jgi:hypothetical protein
MSGNILGLLRHVNKNLLTRFQPFELYPVELISLRQISSACLQSFPANKSVKGAWRSRHSRLEGVCRISRKGKVFSRHELLRLFKARIYCKTQESAGARPVERASGGTFSMAVMIWGMWKWNRG